MFEREEACVCQPCSRANLLLAFTRLLAEVVQLSLLICGTLGFACSNARGMCMPTSLLREFALGLDTLACIGRTLLECSIYIAC